MDGVTVIAEHTAEDYTLVYFVLAVISGANTILLLSCLIWLLKDRINTFFKPLVFLVLIVILGLSLVSGVLCAFSVKRCDYKATYVEHTVTLDVSASYLEFTGKYEVLEEENGLYRVGEQEAET